MGVAFYDQEQKRMKLDRTICLYKGEPYFVMADGRGDNNVSLYELGDGFRRPLLSVDYREDDFDYRAFPLGYTNFGDRAYYISRLPDRQNSQGLTAHCVMAKPDDHRMHVTSWIQSRSAYDTIKGIYPSLQECISAVHPYADGKKSRAFHRHFAVSRWDNKMKLLCYRGRNVGFFEGDHVLFFKSKDMDLVRLAAQKAGVSC